MLGNLSLLLQRPEPRARVATCLEELVGQCRVDVGLDGTVEKHPRDVGHVRQAERTCMSFGIWAAIPTCQRDGHG